MKLNTATLASFPRPAAAVLVLLPLLLISWAEQAAAYPGDRVLSQPLRNEDTYQAVREVSQDVSG